jgi:hypothetical protein
VTTIAQQRAAKALSQTCIPIIPIDLITISDDEEGSEASNITLVLITQEEVPGETFAPAFDDLVLNPQEGDLEARTTLDTIFLEQLEIQPHDDSSKNDMVAGGQEEGMGHLEIGIPTNELSINIDPLPTSPSNTKTSSTDEDQQRAESL